MEWMLICKQKPSSIEYDFKQHYDRTPANDELEQVMSTKRNGIEVAVEA